MDSQNIESKNTEDDKHETHVPHDNNISNAAAYTPPPSTPPEPNPITQVHPAETESKKPNSATAIEIVWQWVCYALWEWSLISLAILLSTTLYYYFNNTSGSDYTYIIYILATMLCLLPLAFVANHIYAKREASQKHGFSAVVMVINAVGVFLATIVALITFVVSLLNTVVSAAPSTSTNIIITSSIIVFTLGAMLFVRIINPLKVAKFSKLFPFIVMCVASVAVILALVGPFRSDVANRQDRLIEQNLPTLNTDIQTYVNTNGNLPSTLQSLTFTDDATTKSLADSNLVSYQIENSYSSTNPTTVSYNSSSSFSYKLCVTYKKAAGSGSISSNGLGIDTSTYIDTTNHPAGYTCYNQTATKY